MPDLKNKVALITGGGRGIGRAIALALAAEGCHVAVTSRTESSVSAVAAEAQKLGVKAAGIATDLADEKNIHPLVDRVTSELGPIDYLINNAAILHAVGLLETSLEQWDETMAINFRSVFVLSQLVLRGMAERNSGYIINVASTVAHGAKQEVAAYSASKFGMVGLSQALYGAGKPYGVRVSTIYPGTTDTPMIRDLNGENRVGNPADWMHPEDIAYCVLFLLKQSPRMVVKELTPWAVGYDKI